MPIFERFDLHIYLGNVPQTEGLDATYRIDIEPKEQLALQFARAKIRRKVICTTIFGHLDRAESIHPILDTLEKHLPKGPWIELRGIRVDATLFDRLTERFELVSLVTCELEHEWWKIPERPRRCEVLHFYPCLAKAPLAPIEGSLAWPELQRLTVRDDDREFPTFESWHANALTLAQAFCGPNLQSLSLDRLKESEFLTGLLPLPNLEEVAIWETGVSNRLLRQIAECPRIKSLDFSATAQLPSEWAALGKLKRLRELDLWQTNLDDEALSQILRHTRLRRLAVWYTEITAQSWPALLTHRSLRTLWASMELLNGPIPELPDSTQLRTFMALNAKVQLYRDLLSRYPELEVDWT